MEQKQSDATIVFQEMDLNKARHAYISIYFDHHFDMIWDYKYSSILHPYFST